jgi:hypothetical protein
MSLTVRSAEDIRRRLSSRELGSSKQITKIQKVSRSKNIMPVRSRAFARAAHFNTTNESNIETGMTLFKESLFKFYQN